MFVKLLIAFVAPFALMVSLSRFSLNMIVGALATIGIMMAVFEGYNHGPTPMAIGTVSLIGGYFVSRKLLKNIKLTE
ncbi:hypothetical protein BEP19_14495 [Ammoniphilus oxalaticus]|uniref:Sodium:proton antiporter n=1 Tax=Ammoniphilus oxalaticus TaxID=66863 RepID=A0A419SFA8_9BACL|nr:DUF2198 family protein [Ammoniphilus oxalaticus]RKD21820.1 hypothetical protein BEP19_14495 [Ammoniphilus oxalaticus]